MPPCPVAARLLCIVACWALLPACGPAVPTHRDRDQIDLETGTLHASIRKRATSAGSTSKTFGDKKTGFSRCRFRARHRRLDYGAGQRSTYRDQLDPDLVYQFDNPYHGKGPKRSIEGPQICTQAKEIQPVVIRGTDFVAIRQTFQYRTAAREKTAGSTWDAMDRVSRGKRYFISMDRIDAVNSSDAMFLRIDMPGHIRHKQGDSFSQIYLSYQGLLESSEFFKDFAPDENSPTARGEQDSATIHPGLQAAESPVGGGRTVAGGHDARSVRRVRGLVPPARATFA